MNSAPIARPSSFAAEPAERQPRELTPAERRVRLWIKQNHGILSKIARECDKSVQFVQRIAYAREAQSKGFVVERKLASAGCPMIQKFH